MFIEKLLKKIKKEEFLKEIENQRELKIMEDIKTSENFKLVDERRAAKMLGVSYTKLKYLRAQGKIGFVRIGRSIRYRISQLERFIQAGIVEAEK